MVTPQAPTAETSNAGRHADEIPRWTAATAVAGETGWGHPTVAAAYVILAGFLYGLASYPELVSAEMAPAKEAEAHPAE